MRILGILGISIPNSYTDKTHVVKQASVAKQPVMVSVIPFYVFC